MISPTLGIIGGGQLGCMLAHVAIQWGYDVVVFDPNPNAPAGRLAKKHIIADYTCKDAIAQLLALSDHITYEFEHLPKALIDTLKSTHVHIIPSLETLEIIQDKYRQKQHLKNNHLPVAPDCEVHHHSALETFFHQHKQLILKCKYGGYDGKGTYFVHQKEDLQQALDYYGPVPVYAEAMVDFVKELSVMVIKKGADLLTYPVAENRHHQGILVETLVPASLSEAIHQEASHIAKRAIATFDSDGLFCVELFLTARGELLINEIAPRAHNSGHYTIEACTISQYEAWLRILMDLPLQSPQLNSPTAMVNLLGNQSVVGPYKVHGIQAVAAVPQTKLHLYGKKNTEHRKKLGHITSLGSTAEEALKLANQALQSIEIVPGSLETQPITNKGV